MAELLFVFAPGDPSRYLSSHRLLQLQRNVTPQSRRKRDKSTVLTLARSRGSRDFFRDDTRKYDAPLLEFQKEEAMIDILLLLKEYFLHEN